MADSNQPVELGVLAIDCTALESFVEDLPPGALVGMRARQPGYKDVVNEIISNQPTFGGRAGVTDEDLQSLRLADERIDLIDAQLPAARKLVEMLEETRSKLDDQCQRQISAIALSVQSRARAYNDDDLLARYEKTRTYRSAPGLKAAKTRRKNAEAAEATTDPTIAAAPAAATPAEIEAAIAAKA